MALIVKYKFQNVDANGNSVTLLPQFPSGVSYTKTDVVEGNITTRVIETDDLSKVTYIRFGCDEVTYAEGVWGYLTEILDINISYVNTFHRMFRGCTLLNKIDVSTWDTSRVTNIGNMFQNCSSLTQLDVSNWDISNVTNMNYMFQDCSRLTQLDVSNWDTKNVQYMQGVFYNCSQLAQLDLSNFDTSNATNMNSMFKECKSLTSLNVSNFDTSNVTIMSSMFYNCSKLTQLDVSNFDTSNVTDMASIFQKCSKLAQLDLSNFDTSKVTNMSNMFYNCNVKNVGLIYCSEDTINKLANCITSPCNFYVTNKTYTSPNPLVKYVMYREDKKPLLYYNDETQTWGKPVLREWDSIEKHADGKYYYHKRSGEAIVDGKNWYGYIERENTVRVTRNNIKHIGYNNFITDKYIIQDIYNNDIEGIQGSGTSTDLFISINKSKLLEISLDGVSNYLNSNNFVIVYQLAEEKVYECTDLDLITYENETNLAIKSGVLNPKVTLKIHQNITNIVTILQEKVSVLENVFIQGLKQVLAGDMQSLAYMLYPEDFENIEQSIDETSLGEQQDDPTDE